MKKYILLLIAAVFLVACGGADKEYKEQLKESEKQLEEAVESREKAEEVSEQIDKTTELIEEVQEEMGIENDVVDEEDNVGIDELKELLEYEALGEEDALTELVDVNGEIKATVEIGDNDLIEDKTLLAESLYSSAGDVLLEHDNWEILTIDFVDIGEISLHRDEKETNEYDMDYFPLEKIIGQLD